MEENEFKNQPIKAFWLLYNFFFFWRSCFIRRKKKKLVFHLYYFIFWSKLDAMSASKINIKRKKEKEKKECLSILLKSYKKKILPKKKNQSPFTSPPLVPKKKKKYLIKFRPDSGYVFKTRPGLRIAIKKFKLQVVYSGSVYATPFHNNHNSLFKKKKKLIKI